MMYRLIVRSSDIGRRHIVSRFGNRWGSQLLSLSLMGPDAPGPSPQQQAAQSSRSLATATTTVTSETSRVGNGPILNMAMLYHDSVAFLVSNHLGIPAWMMTHQDTSNSNGQGTTPAQIAQAHDLSIRAASALMVTLCRVGVVQVIRDDDDSVDDVVYQLTPDACRFLGDPAAASYTGHFADTLHTNFIDPARLLESFRPPQDTSKDLMSEHLEQNDEEVANNARHFMKHMNSQSYSCAEALPSALGLAHVKEPITMLDVGGGSAIYPIAAARCNPLVRGIVYELPNIQPITEEFIKDAGLADQITVVAGDFFTTEPFLPHSTADIVLFSNILHDWPDATNMQLLKKAHECLKPGGRVVISELLLADDVVSSTSSATSMNIIMLPYTQGRQYRAKELFRRLERVGFRNPYETHLVDDYSLVIAERPAV